MRRILVDNARRKATQKHGGNFERRGLDELSIAESSRPKEILAVHNALDGLAADDHLAAELVKTTLLHRVFAGRGRRTAERVPGHRRGGSFLDIITDQSGSELNEEPL